MKVVPLETTTLTVPELVAMAQHEPVVLTRGGQPCATLKNVSGSDWESTSPARNPEFAAIIE